MARRRPPAAPHESFRRPRPTRDAQLVPVARGARLTPTPGRGTIAREAEADGRGSADREPPHPPVRAIRTSGVRGRWSLGPTVAVRRLGRPSRARARDRLSRRAPVAPARRQAPALAGGTGRSMVGDA